MISADSASSERESSGEGISLPVFFMACLRSEVPVSHKPQALATAHCNGAQRPGFWLEACASAARRKIVRAVAPHSGVIHAWGTRSAGSVGTVGNSASSYTAARARGSLRVATNSAAGETRRPQNSRHKSVDKSDFLRWIKRFGQCAFFNHFRHTPAWPVLSSASNDKSQEDVGPATNIDDACVSDYSALRSRARKTRCMSGIFGRGALTRELWLIFRPACDFFFRFDRTDMSSPSRGCVLRSYFCIRLRPQP